MSVQRNIVGAMAWMKSVFCARNATQQSLNTPGWRHRLSDRPAFDSLMTKLERPTIHSRNKPSVALEIFADAICSAGRVGVSRRSAFGVRHVAGWE